MRYTDDFRAWAVVMLESADYPKRPGALMEISKALKVPHPTLSRWFRRKQNPPPDELVQVKKEDLISMIKGEIHRALSEMPLAIQDADYKELATSIGILIDKMQLLDGEPTARTAVVNELSDEERINRVDELLNRGRARRDGRPASDEFVQ